MMHEISYDARECPDPALLAAFVEGRLSGSFQRRVLEHLDSCESCYEVVVEAMRFEEEEEALSDEPNAGPGEAPGAQVVVHPRARSWWKVVLPLTAAVAALLLVVLGRPLFKGSAGEDADAGTGFTVADLVAGHALEGGAWPGEDWPGSRGPGEPAPLSPGAQAFQVGVRLVDLEVVAEQSGPESRDAAAALARLFPSRPYSDAEAWLDTASRRQLELLLPMILPEPYLALGKWAEAGHRAAVAGDLAFFEKQAVRRLPLHLEDTDLDPSIRVAVGEIGAMLDAGPGKEDLPRLAVAFGDLLRFGGHMEEKTFSPGP